MLTLAIDTALNACSVAIMRGREGVFDKFFLMDRGHAEAIGPLTADAFTSTGISAEDIHRIGVVTGPGSFAGVRVGIAFARGFAIGRAIEVRGVNSLRALHATALYGARDGAGAIAPYAGGARPIATVIDARRGEVYAGLFGPDGDALVAPFCADPGHAARAMGAAIRSRDFAPALVTGPGAALLAPAGVPLDPALEPGPPVTAIAPLALADMVARLPEKTPENASGDAGRDGDDMAPVPLYIRPPDAKPGAPSPFAGLF